MKGHRDQVIKGYNTRYCDPVLDVKNVPVSREIGTTREFEKFFVHQCGNKIPTVKNGGDYVKCSRCGIIINLTYPRCPDCLQAFDNQTSLAYHRHFCKGDRNRHKPTRLYYPIPGRLPLPHPGRLPLPQVLEMDSLQEYCIPEQEPEPAPGQEPDPDDSLDTEEPGSLEP